MQVMRPIKVFEFIHQKSLLVLSQCFIAGGSCFTNEGIQFLFIFHHFVNYNHVVGLCEAFIMIRFSMLLFSIMRCKCLSLLFSTKSDRLPIVSSAHYCFFFVVL